MKNIFTKKLNWWQGLLLILLIIFIGQFLVARYISSNLEQKNEIQEKTQTEELSQISDEEKKDSGTFFTEADIVDIVKEIKDKLLLPNQIDEVTLLNDIVAESNVIHYYYVVPDFVIDLFLDDSTGGTFSDEYIKMYCNDVTAKSFLELGINMKYSFSSEISNQHYSIFITKEDCYNR